MIDIQWIPFYILSAILFVETFACFWQLFKKKPRKSCFGEWGFEGEENCELCRDDEDCDNCSN